MGRLIDADHLLFLLNSAIELRKKLHRNTSDLDMMVDAVNDEPTAYDPDKVVQQLEEKTELAFQRYMNCTKNSPCYQRYQEQYLQRKMCLEIVKAGGADAKTDS